MSSQWVDADGAEWRFSKVNGTWQKKVNGTWRITSLPSGGLQRVTPGVDNNPNVVILETMGPPGPPGPPGPVAPPPISEVLPSESQNGVNATFSLSEQVDISQAIQVFRNGLLEIRGLGYLVTENTVTFTTPPLDSDVIAVVYQKAQ